MIPNFCHEVDPTAGEGNCGTVLRGDTYAVHIPFHIYFKGVGLRVSVYILVIHTHYGCALVLGHIIPPVIV